MRPPEVHLLGRSAEAALERARPRLPVGTTAFRGWPDSPGPTTVVLLACDEVAPRALNLRLREAPKTLAVLAVVSRGRSLAGPAVYQLVDEKGHPSELILETALCLWAQDELPPTSLPLSLRPHPVDTPLGPEIYHPGPEGLPGLPGPWRIFDSEAELAPEVEELLRTTLWPWPKGPMPAREAALRAWREARWPLAWMADSLRAHLEGVRRTAGKEAMARALSRIVGDLPGEEDPRPELDEEGLPLALAELADEAQQHDRSVLLQLVRARDLAKRPLDARLREEGWQLRRKYLPPATGPWRLIEEAWEACDRMPITPPPRGHQETSAPSPLRRHGGVHLGRWFVPWSQAHLVAARGWNWPSLVSPERVVPSLPLATRPRASDPGAALWQATSVMREERADGWWLTWGEGQHLREAHLGKDGSEAMARLVRFARAQARGWWRKSP